MYQPFIYRSVLWYFYGYKRADSKTLTSWSPSGHVALGQVSPLHRWSLRALRVLRRDQGDLQRLHRGTGVFFFTRAIMRS